MACIVQPALVARAAASTWKRSPPESVSVSQKLTLASPLAASPPLRAACSVPLSPDEMCSEKMCGSNLATLRYSSANNPLDGMAVVGTAGRMASSRS